MDPTNVPHSPRDLHQDHRNVHHATLVAAGQVPRVLCSSCRRRRSIFAPPASSRSTPSSTASSMRSGLTARRSRIRAYLDDDLLRWTARYWARFAHCRYVEPLKGAATPSSRIRWRARTRPSTWGHGRCPLGPMDTSRSGADHRGGRAVRVLHAARSSPRKVTGSSFLPPTSTVRSASTRSSPSAACCYRGATIRASPKLTFDRCVEHRVDVLVPTVDSELIRSPRGAASSRPPGPGRSSPASGPSGCASTSGACRKRARERFGFRAARWPMRAGTPPRRNCRRS